MHNAEKFVKVLYNAVKNNVFTKKFVKSTQILLSGMASKFGINFSP